MHEIRDAVLRIVNDKPYRDLLIQRGLENIKRFRLEYIAEQYANLYREVDLGEGKVKT